MNLFVIFYIIRFSIFAMMYSFKYWFFSLISNYWVRHYHWVIKGSLIIVPFFNFWNIGCFLDPGLSLLRVVFRGMGDPEVRAHPEEGTGAPQDHLSPKITMITMITTTKITMIPTHAQYQDHPSQTGDDTSHQGRQSFFKIGSKFYFSLGIAYDSLILLTHGNLA